MPQPTLHTDRITLVPLADEHFEWEVELDSDPEVMRYLTGGVPTTPRRQAAIMARILDEYEAIADEVGFHIIDATLSIEKQQQQMREIVVKELGESLKNGVLRMAPGEAHAAETTPSVL